MSGGLGRGGRGSTHSLIIRLGTLSKRCYFFCTDTVFSNLYLEHFIEIGWTAAVKVVRIWVNFNFKFVRLNLH